MLCLNMIVRNEADRIERCLTSVLPFISYYVILDTGSTDDTIAKIERIMDTAGIPGEVHQGEFHTFGQARNDALALARASAASFDNILLCDADMELVVEHEQAFDTQLAEGHDAWSVRQVAGGMSYDNVRIVRRAVDANYIGSTHEYLNVRPHSTMHSVYFIDHADGSNRKNKYDRDIALLNADVLANPKDSRAWFYLGNSYRDAGLPTLAIQAYTKRLELAGWDEELWNTQFNIGLCERERGNETAFVIALLEAYDMRPSRAEPLYELAQFYRLKGKNQTALMYLDTAMRIVKPNDSLFVSDAVYQHGLKDEFAITAFYDPYRRLDGFKVCNDLALMAKYPEHSRAQARANIFHYILPLADHMTVDLQEIDNIVLPDGYNAMNPSITRHNGQLLAAVRTVNYIITPEGRYQIRDLEGSVNDANPIITRNKIVGFSDNMVELWARDVVWKAPPPQYHLVLGLEDMRLFSYRDELCATACVRELNSSGACQQVFMRLEQKDEFYEVAEWTVLSTPDTHEKNWMPLVRDHDLHLVSRLGTIFQYDPDRGMHPALAGNANGVDDMAISGGSQMIPFNAGYLGVVHEARYKPDGQRYYMHRFVWLNDKLETRRVSMPFYFMDRQIEFVAGIERHADKIVVSFGVRDEQAWTATVTQWEVSRMLGQELVR